MDLFSHGLLPYLLGNFFKRRKEEITAFVLGGISLDIDIFIIWINSVYPTSYLLTHRGITHSLFFGFFTAILVLYLASRDWIRNRVRRYADFKPVITLRTMIFAYMGVIMHLFLDYTTTKGVPLFYPFDATRYSAEVFFYTDMYLTILSLIIIIYLYKKPISKHTNTKFLVIFLVVFALLGGLRIYEKTSAESFFKETNLTAYPTMSIFDWYVAGEDGNKINIYEYNGYRSISVFNETVPDINIVSSGGNMTSALEIAGELPQVKMFEWGSYTVAINATSSNGIWYFDYYDPVQNAMRRGASAALFRRINAPLSVKVETGKAIVYDKK